jgi:hypothetical protein
MTFYFLSDDSQLPACPPTGARLYLVPAPVYPVGIFQSTGMKFEEYFTGPILEQKTCPATDGNLSLWNKIENFDAMHHSTGLPRRRPWGPAPVK